MLYFSTFPVAFLYRQALELMLKAILIEYHGTYSKDPKRLLNANDRGHRLPAAYIIDLQDAIAGPKTGKPVIHVRPEKWAYLRDVLKDWQDNDPLGLALRYSIDKSAKELTNENLLSFNVERFSEGMEEALEILADIKDELDRLRDEPYRLRYEEFLRSEGNFSRTTH